METYEIEIHQVNKATIRVQANDNTHAQALALDLIEANAINFDDVDTVIKYVTEIK